MKAIEFNSSIQNGVIHMPRQYTNLQNIPAKVIVLIDEFFDSTGRKLSLKKLMIEGYKSTINEDKEILKDFEKSDLENWD